MRLRCREIEEGGSYARIVIYLLEPHICEYILVVESALFCEGLQTVDEYGLQTEMPELIEEETDADQQEYEQSQGTPVTKATPPPLQEDEDEHDNKKEASQPQQRVEL